jgi:hypothetical protein
MATATKLVTEKDALELQRKAFVRDYCIRAERWRQNYKPRRSKNREEEQIRQVLRDVTSEVISVDEWRLQFVFNANRAWEKRLIREWVRQPRIFSYKDLKAFVQAQPWSENWPPKKIAALWRTICRNGKL